MATTVRPEVTGRRWTASAADAIAHVTRVALVGVLTGLAIGVLARVLMRLSFLLRPDTAGRLTEAGERIGEFTLGGSAALLMFVGLSNGLFAAAIYLAVEPWLRSLGDVHRWRWHGVGVVGAAVALLGPQAFSDELDFVILQPPSVHVVMFGTLPVVGGVLFWTLLRRLHRRGPPAHVGRLRWALRIVGLVAFTPVLLAHPVALFDSTFSRPAVAAMPFYLVAAVATLVWWQRRAVGAVPPRWLVRIGMGCTAMAIALGVAQFLRVAVDQL